MGNNSLLLQRGCLQIQNKRLSPCQRCELLLSYVTVQSHHFVQQYLQQLGIYDFRTSVPMVLLAKRKRSTPTINRTVRRYCNEALYKYKYKATVSQNVATFLIIIGLRVTSSIQHASMLTPKTTVKQKRTIERKPRLRSHGMHHNQHITTKL